MKKGEQIALSGNSGHSFAPHLHYQLEDASGRVLDPFDVHRTERRALAAAARPAFDAAAGALDAALGGAARPRRIVPAVPPRRRRAVVGPPRRGWLPRLTRERSRSRMRLRRSEPGVRGARSLRPRQEKGRLSRGGPSCHLRR